MYRIDPVVRKDLVRYQFRYADTDIYYLAVHKLMIGPLRNGLVQIVSGRSRADMFPYLLTAGL